MSFRRVSCPDCRVCSADKPLTSDPARSSLNAACGCALILKLESRRPWFDSFTCNIWVLPCSSMCKTSRRSRRWYHPHGHTPSSHNECAAECPSLVVQHLGHPWKQRISSRQKTSVCTCRNRGTSLPIVASSQNTCSIRCSCKHTKDDIIYMFG